MNLLKENGDNIDLWTIDELKDLVDRFIEKSPRKQKTEEAKSEPVEEAPASTIISPHSQPSSVVMVPF